jgi:tetratricopeptide (TPR) repeat protein
MACAYEAKGMYDKAADVLESYLHDISEHPHIRWQLAYLNLCRGEYSHALEEAEKLDPWNSDIKGIIYHCSSEWDKAEGEYLNMLDSRISRDVFSARRYLGSLYLLQGRFDEARRQLTDGIAHADLVNELSWKQEMHSDMAYYHFVHGDLQQALEQNSTALEYAVKGESIRGQIGCLHFSGLVQVKAGLLDEAQRTAEELKKLIESWIDQKLMRYYYHLIGEIEFKKRKVPEAIKDFKKAAALLPCQHYTWDLQLPAAHALFYDSLACAYFETGDLDSAQGQFEAITNMMAAKLAYGDKFTKSYFMLAKIFEQKEQREEAKKHYEKYLELLKNADEAIPEVGEAQKRLAALKPNNAK